jgi:hypothetical protein
MPASSAWPTLIVNASLVFSPNERKAELERIGVPVLQTLPSLAMDATQWAQSKDGLAQTDIAAYYSPSELAGMTDPMLVSARDAATGTLRRCPRRSTRWPTRPPPCCACSARRRPSAAWRCWSTTTRRARPTSARLSSTCRAA